MPWVALVDGIPTVIDVYGTFQAEYQPKTGMWNASCHLFIDFDDPSMLTIDEVCAMFPDLLNCSHGTLIYRNFECTGFGLFTYDTSYVVNPSGHGTGKCRFNPMNP
jgi:hypothetical protein